MHNPNCLYVLVFNTVLARKPLLKYFVLVVNLTPPPYIICTFFCTKLKYTILLAELNVIYYLKKLDLTYLYLRVVSMRIFLDY